MCYVLLPLHTFMKFNTSRAGGVLKNLQALFSFLCDLNEWLWESHLNT